MNKYLVILKSGKEVMIDNGMSMDEISQVDWDTLNALIHTNEEKEFLGFVAFKEIAALIKQ